MSGKLRWCLGFQRYLSCFKTIKTSSVCYLHSNNKKNKERKSSDFNYMRISVFTTAAITAYLVNGISK